MRTEFQRKPPLSVRLNGMSQCPGLVATCTCTSWGRHHGCLHEHTAGPPTTRTTTPTTIDTTNTTPHHPRAVTPPQLSRPSPPNTKQRTSNAAKRNANSHHHRPEEVRRGQSPRGKLRSQPLSVHLHAVPQLPFLGNGFCLVFITFIPIIIIAIHTDTWGCRPRPCRRPLHHDAGSGGDLGGIPFALSTISRHCVARLRLLFSLDVPRAPSCPCRRPAQTGRLNMFTVATRFVKVSYNQLENNRARPRRRSRGSTSSTGKAHMPNPASLVRQPPTFALWLNNFE